MYRTETYSRLQHATTFPYAAPQSTSYLPQEFAAPRFTKAYTYSTSSTSSLHSYSKSLTGPVYPQFSPPGAKTSPTTTTTLTPKALSKLLRTVTPPRPDRSKRFLASKFYFSSLETTGNSTFLTLTSSNLTWGTLCNSLTLGLTAPLCRVYFVELLLQDRVLPAGSPEAADFLHREFGFGVDSAQESCITGETLALWLEGQQSWEGRTVSFEKMQGNCFAVYCVAVPRWSATAPDGLALRRRAAKRYQVLDGFDSVLMLMGRFHNSLWGLFK